MSRVPRFHTAPPRPQKHVRTERVRRFTTALALGLVALLGLANLSTYARRQDQSTDAEGTIHRSFYGSSSKSAQAGTEFVPGDILVRYRGGEEKAKVKEIVTERLRRNGREIPVDVRRFDGSRLVDGLRLARVPAEDTLAATAALRADPDVLYAEPNYIRRKAVLPNDGRFGEVWALKNIGQQGNVGYPVNNQFINGTPGADIDAELAWNTTTGSSTVVVGVIDTGIDVLHPDLAPNIWVNPGEIAGDGIDNDANGKVDDINGWDFAGNDNTVYDGGTSDPDDHGTHVAGTIGAKGNNGIGVAGVNWNVKLMSLKFLKGPDGEGTDADAIAAFNYAKMMRDRGVNIRVLNCSWGGGGNNQALKNAIESVGQSGILVVAAEGNDGVSNDDYPHYPSSFDNANLVRVSATDRIDELAYFSNFGTRLPSVGAPGRGILSTTPRNYGSATYTEADGSTYSFFSGTSMATPQVAGVAALILAQHPGITVQRLRGALLYSGESIPSLADKVQSARRLNARLALEAAASNDATPPAIGGLSVAAQTGRRVTLQFTTGDDGATGNAALYDVYFTSTSTGVRFHVGSFTPTASGNPQSLSILVPYKQTLGTLALTVYDEAGNNATAQVGVAVSAADAEPYTVSLSAATPLTTGGTPLALVGDDRYRFDYTLPFNFPFYGKTVTKVHVSTNGILYFSPPQEQDGPSPSETATDASTSKAKLNLHSMIAGMWDDIRTDRFSGDVFVVTPDANRIIFRWQGSTFRDDTSPINFEIELRSDGTIQTHYGDGNANVKPLVGISGGQADSYTAGPEDSYVVASHTFTNLVNLTNAQTITFSPSVSAPPACTYSISPTSLNFNAGGGSGSTVQVTTSAGCAWTAVSNSSFITITGGSSGTGGGTVTYSVAPNSGAQRTGTMTIAGQTFTVTQDAAVSCSYAISPSSLNFNSGGGSGVTVQVTAGAGCAWTAQSNNTSFITITGGASGTGNGTVTYAVAANPSTSPRNGTMTIAGQTYTVTQDAASCTYSLSQTSQSFASSGGTGSTNLTTGAGCAWNAFSNASWITINTGSTSGTGSGTINFTIAANTGVERTGTVNIGGQIFTVTQAGIPPTLQLAQNSYNITESAGSVAILVNRTGDLASAVSVNYMTTDASNFLQDCNVMNGKATSRCDYISLVGTLHFAAGENSKNLFIPIVDDTYLEGAETFFLSLFNPSGGAVLDANKLATITITDNGNDGAGQSNPVDSTNFFVRQHYMDFLGREPDPASIGWNNQINNCVPLQPSCDRLSVSQGIYSSPEFKDRGYFIYKFYSVALGRKPTYDEFVLDRARVSGFQTEAELEQSKLDFIAIFMSRPEFAPYNGLTNDQYVQTLFSVAGITQVTVGGVLRTVTEMQQQMAGGRSRAQVLRDIAESPEVSNKFLVESTIVMHYFGYLRRDPDASYQDWINIFNQSGDSRNVTNGFVNSAEYRARFSQ